jgi:type IX secretion system PorP/SprF family membrane protein
MKKLIIIVAVFFSAIWSADAQQLPLYSQYMMNGFLLNPAMAGCVDYTPVRITARRQWEGINNAPQTYAISGHTSLANGTMGAGGYIFADMFGPIGRTGIQGSYAYHLELPAIESKLGLGLSLTAFQYKLDESNLNLLEDGDEAISYGVETSFVPDATFGAYLYNYKYFVGFSGAQLIQYNVGINDNNDNRMIRHYFITAGYRIKAGEKFEIEPSVLLKGTENKSPFSLDFNIKGYFMKNYWAGVSYRTGDAVIAILGVKVDKYYIGYAFDYTFSNIRNHSTGSHEIMIGINIGEGKSSGSTLL